MLCGTCFTRHNLTILPSVQSSQLNGTQTCRALRTGHCETQFLDCAIQLRSRAATGCRWAIRPSDPHTPTTTIYVRALLKSVERRAAGFTRTCPILYPNPDTPPRGRYRIPAASADHGRNAHITASSSRGNSTSPSFPDYERLGCRRIIVTRRRKQNSQSIEHGYTHRADSPSLCGRLEQLEFRYDYDKGPISARWLTHMTEYFFYNFQTAQTAE